MRKDKQQLQKNNQSFHTFYLINYCQFLSFIASCTFFNVKYFRCSQDFYINNRKQMKALQYRTKKNRLSLSNYRSLMNQQNRVVQAKVNLNTANPLVKALTKQKKSSFSNFPFLSIQHPNLLEVNQTNSHLADLIKPKSCLGQNQLRRSFSEQYKRSTKTKKTSFKNQNKINISKKLSLGNLSKCSDINRINYRQNIRQLIWFLIKDQIIKEANNIHYKIQKQVFEQLFFHIITSLLENNSSAQKPANKFQKPLINHFTRVNKKLASIKMNKRRIPLSLSSNIFELRYSPSDYEAQLVKHKMGIQTLLQIKEEIHLEIKEYQQQIKHIQQKSHAIHKKEANQDSISIDQQQKIFSQQRILQHQLFQDINGCKCNKFHNVDAQIINYSLSFQSNQLANYLQYKPLPFETIWITNQLQKLTNQDQNQDVRMKSKRMSEFLIQTIQQFNRKEAQLIRINQFKTKVINNFIEILKKWANQLQKVDQQEEINNKYCNKQNGQRQWSIKGRDKRAASYILQEVNKNTKDKYKKLYQQMI